MQRGATLRELHSERDLLMTCMSLRSYLAHACMALVSACCYVGCNNFQAPANSKTQIEKLHNIALPESAHAFRTGKSQGWFAHVVATLFAINREDEAEFLSQLRVVTEFAPLETKGNPYETGWSVWPQGTPTAVPGDIGLGEAPIEWRTAVPIRMQSCLSPVGKNTLHVELWHVGSRTSLVKVCTMPRE